MLRGGGQVHGWIRVSALSCVFLPVRNARRTRTDEPDPHCLLCVDIGPPGALTSDGAPESDANPQDSDLDNAMPSETYRPAAGSSPLGEGPLFPLRLGDKTAEDPGPPRDLLRPPLTDYLYQDHLCSKEPALQSLHRDLGPPVSSFTVLPPVRSPPSRSQGGVRLGRPGESVAGGGGAAVPPAARQEGRGVKRAEETGGADALTGATERGTRDARRPPAAAPKGTYCCHTQQQERRHLLSTFTLPILKRYSVPLGKLTDTVHRTTVSLGQHWKQAVRTGTAYSRHDRTPAPQLPVLFGTKVPIVVSSQRPL